MGKTSSRERRHEKNRQSILDAAQRIIVEQGPAELSMRSLAQRIDYSPSGLYEYFDSKEQILQAVCSTGHRQLTQAMRQVDERLSARDYLFEIGKVYIDFAAANPRLFPLMFAATPAEPPDAGMLSEDSSYRVLLEAIQRGIDDGVFITSEGFGLPEMAFAAWAMVHGISMLRMTMPASAPTFAAYRDEALLVVSRGLMTG
ncbi:MAG: TetR/AcrR family transcriptional regulator [Chloroflexi bacterium]|nr:MAG: TetR/AcrR family transcriptional regulator [Chloroflexota bacterium]